MMTAAVETIGNQIVVNCVVVHIAAELEIVQMKAAVLTIGNPVVGSFVAH